MSKVNIYLKKTAFYGFTKLFFVKPLNPLSFYCSSIDVKPKLISLIVVNNTIQTAH